MDAVRLSASVEIISLQLRSDPAFALLDNHKRKQNECKYLNSLAHNNALIWESSKGPEKSQSNKIQAATMIEWTAINTL